MARVRVRHAETVRAKRENYERINDVAPARARHAEAATSVPPIEGRQVRTREDRRPVPKRSPYVPALDGLRAFAVFAVVLYHMRTVWAPCGLLGVTLFFVLSGYLITGLIIDEWRRTRFIDLRNFWVKRIRRIIPAIGFLLLCLVVLCGIFSPVMLTKLRNDFVPSLLFFNNWWQIFQNVSYFENLGSPSPVTHLWSLSIEMQFYVVWPLVLLVLFKLRTRKRGFSWFIIALTAASAIEMALLYVPDADPSRVYYGTDTRAFSLLVGAWFAFMFPVGRVRSRRFERSFGLLAELLAFASLGAVVAMVFTVSAYEPFLYRGGFLLVSVLTGLVIVALARERGILSSIFAWSPLVWLGKRSYGLYLWHYPLLLLMNPPTDFGEKPWYVYVVQIAIIIGATEFSYHFVEEPIRHGAIGNALRAIGSRRETTGQLLRYHSGYATVGAALLVGALVFWIAVPPTQVIAEDAQVEGTSVDPAAVIARQRAEAAEQGGDGADGSEGSGDDAPAAASSTANARVASLAALPDDPWKWNILLIGDSVSAATEPDFEDYFVHGAIDARANRDLQGGADVLKTWMDGGWDGDAVVLALGSNTWADDDEFRKEYQELLDLVPEDTPIFLINNRFPGVDGDRANNPTIAALAEENEGVYLVDWFNGSAGHSDWFYSDGTHLVEGTGTKGFITVLDDVLEEAHAEAKQEAGTGKASSKSPTKAKDADSAAEADSESGSDADAGSDASSE